MICKSCGFSGYILEANGSIQCDDCNANIRKLAFGLQFQPKSDDPYHDLIGIDHHSMNQSVN